MATVWQSMRQHGMSVLRHNVRIQPYSSTVRWTRGMSTQPSEPVSATPQSTTTQVTEQVKVTEEKVIEEPSQTPDVLKSFEALKVSAIPDILEAAQSSQAAQVPQVPQVPQVSQVFDVLKSFEALKVTDIPKLTETPKEADTPTDASTNVSTEPKVQPFDVNIIPKDDIISQVVNTFMRDGKKTKAQKIIIDSMKILQKKTEAPNPYVILTEAIELASPLLKLTTTKKGSKVTSVPTPLRERQRRRRAITWIIDAASKRNDKTFEQKFASEIYDINQGVSGVLQKKSQLHKQVLANRANAQVSYNN